MVLAPFLTRKEAAKASPLRMARGRRPLPGTGGERGGRVHTGLWWDGKDTYVNTFRAMTLWGAAKFRLLLVASQVPKCWIVATLSKKTMWAFKILGGRESQGPRPHIVKPWGGVQTRVHY